MAIAKSLPFIDPRFMQECPLCQRSNRIVVKGVFKLGDKIEIHPDMGYSFCNCRNIFYTDIRNVRQAPQFNPDESGITTFTLPDPFFAWPDPYKFYLWDVRKYAEIWDMDEFCDELISKGYEIIDSYRDFDVHSQTPQCFHVKARRAS